MENESKLILFWCIDCKDPIFDGEKWFKDEKGFYHHKECIEEKALFFNGFEFVGEGEE